MELIIYQLNEKPISYTVKDHQEATSLVRNTPEIYEDSAYALLDNGVVQHCGIIDYWPYQWPEEDL